MRRPVLHPLRNRNYRLLFIGQTTSGFGSSFAVVAMAFAVLQVTGSVRDVGLALAATRLPLVVFVLLGGVIGDRLSRRGVMLGSDGVRLLAQAAVAALLLLGVARLWELLVLFGVSGLAQAFFNPAAVGLIPEIVGEQDLQSSNALLDLSRNASALVGQLLGGALVTLTSPGAAFALDSASYLISAVALGSMTLNRSARMRPPRNLIAELREGWSEFRSRSWLWVGVVQISSLNAFALVSFFALGPVVAQRSLGGGAAWGFVGASFALGLIAGSAVATRWRPAKPLVVAFAVVILAAPQLAMLAIPAPLPLIGLAAFLGGSQASIWGALWMTTMQREIPADAIARVAAYSQVGSLVLAPVGFAAVGFVAQAIGISAVLWAGAVWILASTLVVVSVPAIRLYRAPASTVATA